VQCSQSQSQVCFRGVHGISEKRDRANPDKEVMKGQKPGKGKRLIYSPAMSSSVSSRVGGVCRWIGGDDARA